MEADWVVFTLLGDYYKYQSWLSSYRQSNDQAIITLETLLKDPNNCKKLLKILHSYKKSIIQHFNNVAIPIVLVSGLMNGERINEPLKWLFNYLLIFLRSEGFEVITSKHSSSYREINAAVDMKIMIQAKHFVGEKGSTFAQNIARIRTAYNMPSAIEFCSLNDERACNPNW